jgi:hypothetical protein
MATLAQIRLALIETIQAYVEEPIWVYEYLEEMTQLPAVIAAVEDSNFEGAFQNGLHTWDFLLYVLVSRNLGAGDGQRLLDELVSGFGPNSIAQALYENSDLGLVEETDAHVNGVKSYGGALDMGQIPHIGAIISVTVRTRGHA